MKKVLLLLTTLAIASLSFAQSDLIKPAKGDWGLGFRFQGLGNVLVGSFDQNSLGQPQLLARRYLTDRIVVRTTFGLNMQSDELTQSSDFAGTFNGAAARIDSAFSQSVSSLGFSLAPGVEYHLASSASRLDPYVGAYIPVAFQGATTEEIDNRLTVTSSEDGSTLFNSDLSTTTEIDGGLGIGFGVVAGFNWFVASNVSLGAEYNLGLLINSVGGNYTERTVGSIQPNADPNNVQAIDNQETGQVELSSTGINLNTLGVNLSIFW